MIFDHDGSLDQAFTSCTFLLNPAQLFNDILN